MKKLLTLLICCFCVIKGEATTLRAILVGDTNDKTIGISVRQDLYNMTNKLLNISNELEISFDRKLVVGRVVNPLSIQNALDEVIVEEGDIVLFYYSGHGFRTESKGENPWPYLYCSGPNQGFDVEEVLSALQERNPKLLLLLTDVCNNVVPVEDAPQIISMKLSRSLYLPNDLKHNYEELFLNTEGVIVATGSQVGEFALCDERGGYFSRSFFEGLDYVARRCTSDAVNWENVLSHAYSYTLQKAKQDQHPDYFIDLMSD